MTKNKLEKKFSSSARESEFWFMKLHNNMLTHQTTPADYIMTTMTNGYLNSILVECKQVTCKEDGKGRLAFKRLKQMHDLKAFEDVFPAHRSFFCIAYFDRRWANSDIYIVPVFAMEMIIADHPYVSMNRIDALLKFGPWKVESFEGIFKYIKGSI